MKSNSRFSSKIVPLAMVNWKSYNSMYRVSNFICQRELSFHFRLWKKQFSLKKELVTLKEMSNDVFIYARRQVCFSNTQRWKNLLKNIILTISIPLEVRLAIGLSVE